MPIITYEYLREWRDICEFLDREWYKFVDADENNFFLLSLLGREHRGWLWTEYFIQLVRWSKHPHAEFHYRSPYRKHKGWILLPGWERKIDFLEQVVILGRSPQDLEQPWRKEIWRSLAKKIETKVQAELQQRQRIADFERRIREHQANLQEHRERQKLLQLEYQKHIEQGGCPAFFGCFNMSGVLHSKDCLNFQTCKSISFYQFE